jgi:hypothetical protein
MDAVPLSSDTVSVAWAARSTLKQGHMHWLWRGRHHSNHEALDPSISAPSTSLIIAPSIPSLNNLVLPLRTGSQWTRRCQPVAEASLTSTISGLDIKLGASLSLTTMRGVYKANSNGGVCNFGAEPALNSSTRRKRGLSQYAQSIRKVSEYSSPWLWPHLWRRAVNK